MSVMTFVNFFVERVSVTRVGVGCAPKVLEIFPSCRLREGGFDILGDGTYQSRTLHPNFVANKTKEDRINRIKYTMKEDPSPLQKLNGPLGLAMSKTEMYHALNDEEQARYAFA